jgi:hypothetical protein
VTSPELAARRAEIKELERQLASQEAHHNAKLSRLDRIGVEIDSVNRRRGEILRDIKSLKDPELADKVLNFFRRCEAFGYSSQSQDTINYLRFSLQLANQKVLTDRSNIQLKDLDGRLAKLLTERDELRAELGPDAEED